MSHVLRPFVLLAVTTFAIADLAAASQVAAAPEHPRGASAPAATASSPVGKPSAAHRPPHRTHAGASAPAVMCGGMGPRGGHGDMPMDAPDAASRPMMGMGSPCMASSAPAP
jgi:hypothetical protein